MCLCVYVFVCVEGEGKRGLWYPLNIDINME